MELAPSILLDILTSWPPIVRQTIVLTLFFLLVLLVHKNVSYMELVNILTRFNDSSFKINQKAQDFLIISSKIQAFNIFSVKANFTSQFVWKKAAGVLN